MTFIFLEYLRVGLGILQSGIGPELGEFGVYVIVFLTLASQFSNCLQTILMFSSSVACLPLNQRTPSWLNWHKLMGRRGASDFCVKPRGPVWLHSSLII